MNRPTVRVPNRYRCVPDKSAIFPERLDKHGICLDNPEMSTKPLKPMTRIRRKISDLVRLTEMHCGHEREVQKAIRCRFDLEDMIEAAIEDAKNGQFHPRDL